MMALQVADELPALVTGLDYMLELKEHDKGRTQCTRLPLYAGSGRGECRLALLPFMKRLLPSLEPETYRSWAKALAASATSDGKIT
ncbi:hypothetical protein ACFX1X_019688 [Malus domestica]